MGDPQINAVMLEVDRIIKRCIVRRDDITRYRSMDGIVEELERCLAVVDSRLDASGTPAPSAQAR